ncbi:MAG: hypothetical protein L0H93_11250 [Nocardioides sp.]|nr:hypothetical protein [Nocardioides sp.]
MNDYDEPPYRIFSLTKMTGRESKQMRTAIVAGVEVSLRPFAVCLAGFVVGIIPAASTWSLLGSRAGAIPFVFAALAWWLFERRTHRGLRLRTWQSVRDTTMSRPYINQFMLCGKVIDLDGQAPGVLSKSSTPIPHLAAPDSPGSAHAPAASAFPGDGDWWHV